MNFKSWLLISEMAKSFAPEYLETNSLQALSENLPESDLKARYKRLVSEWDYGKDEFGQFKNKKDDGEQLTPSDITPGSSKMINWKCEKGHIWPAPLSNRKNGRNCPTCTNRQVGKDNSLQALSETELDPVLKARYKRLVSEWDYGKDEFGQFKNKKNDGKQLTPADVTTSASKMINWKCKEGHIWEARIDNRKNGKNCPDCSITNKRITNDNSLQGLSENESNPDKARYKKLVSEWDYGKDEFGQFKNKKDDGEQLTPKDVMPKSNKMIIWKCLENKTHTWKAPLYNRTNGSNCPDCAIAKASLNNQIKNDQNLKNLGIHFNDKNNPDKEDPLPNDPLSDFLYHKRKAYQDFKNKTNYTSSKWYKTDKKVGEEAGLPKGWYLTVDKKGISKPAKLVEKILNKYFDDVATEYIDKECNITTGQCFRFDYSFIYDDQEYFVEYHGEQHYYPIYFGSGENKTKQEIEKDALKQFEYIQKNDFKKYNYCLNKSFPLLVIPYWKNANDFEDIILNFIRHDDEFNETFANPVVPQKNKEYHDIKLKMTKCFASGKLNCNELFKKQKTTLEQFLINKNFINI